MTIQPLKPALAALAACLTLSGCVTYEYQRFAEGPPYEVAMNHCQLQSYYVPQDTSVFVGSPLYANSMAFSRTMANQSRMAEFMALCMRQFGWRLVEVPAK